MVRSGHCELVPVVHFMGTLVILEEADLGHLYKSYIRFDVKGFQIQQNHE